MNKSNQYFRMLIQITDLKPDTGFRISVFIAGFGFELQNLDIFGYPDSSSLNYTL